MRLFKKLNEWTACTDTILGYKAHKWLLYLLSITLFNRWVQIEWNKFDWFRVNYYNYN